MTRVRFDPHFVEHERWERLGIDAFVLHFAALSYTVRTLSDGVISAARIRVLTPLVDDPEAVAQQLVDDGLWSQLEGGAVAVCTVRDDLRFSDDRGDDQPSRAYVEGEKKRANERKEKWKSKRRATAPEAERVPERVPNASRNGAQSSALRPSAVQDPGGSLSCNALDGAQLVRQVHALRPKWTKAETTRARERLAAAFEPTSGPDAQADADALLLAVASRDLGKVPRIGDFIDARSDADLLDLPEVKTAVVVAARARWLDRQPNGDDARRLARSVLGAAASAAAVDRDAEQHLHEEPDYRWHDRSAQLSDELQEVAR